jgi:uncharacterized protein (TIRG00374 family)
MIESPLEIPRNPEAKPWYSWTYVLRFSVALLLISYLIHSAGLSKLFATFGNLNPLAVIATVISSMFFLFLGAINIWLLLRAMHSIPFFKFMKSYIFSYSVNLFTPGQIGDASLGLFLKKQGVPYSQSTVAYSIDKGITALILFSIAGVGVKMFLPQVNLKWLIILPMAAVSLILAVGSGIWLIRWNSSFLRRLQGLLKNAILELTIFKDKWYLIAVNLCLTVAKWLVMSLTFYLGFYCLGVSIKWPEISIIPATSTIAAYVPISIGGLGTVEYLAIYLFSLIAVDEVKVLGAYLFLRCLTYFQAGVILFISILRMRNEKRI